MDHDRLGADAASAWWAALWARRTASIEPLGELHLPSSQQTRAATAALRYGAGRL